MQTRGSQANKHVAFLDRFRIKHFHAVNNTHAEARQVVIGGVHNARMLGHLATDQGASCLTAAFANTGNNIGNRLGLKLAHGNVVQEEQRLGARCQNVVHAHGNKVNAHAVVLV